LERLRNSQHEVSRLVRHPPAQPDEIEWDPDRGVLNAADLEGIDAVIHLGGVNIASGRWNEKFKKRIRDSRVKSTRLLAMTMSELDRPPRSFLCATGIGNYGDQGDELLDESSSEADNFLASVGKEWEAACGPASASGIRVVNLRFGLILGTADGALAKMLPVFRMGIGGVVGSGRQWWSWIGLKDTVSAIVFLLEHEDLNGPFNLVAPNPSTNREFTNILGKVLRRPTLFPLPAFAARIALGPMAIETLLASTRVQPKRLLDAGFQFEHPDLESALRHELGH
tara:strand:+ start:8153 stop:9001 length:849 start_codon:yes stop_codon:yes gene_type:complete